MSGRLSRRERHERIIAALRARPTVRISELADEFGVSTETVRRDIDHLSGQGLVDRTYGGAAVRPAAEEPGVSVRHYRMVDERMRMARRATSLVASGETLMIDAGATTLHLARRLATSDLALTVLTNSVAVATTLSQSAAVRVILCPGDFLGREAGVYGPETLAFIRRFHADKAFIGASGLTVEGPTDADSSACWVKRAMLERADRRLLLIDHGKFGERALEVVCPLDALDDLVTDAAPDDVLRNALARSAVAVHLAEATPAADHAGRSAGDAS